MNEQRPSNEVAISLAELHRYAEMYPALQSVHMTLAHEIERLQRREYVMAQHAETGRYWSGPREDIPLRFAEVPERAEGGPTVETYPATWVDDRTDEINAMLIGDGAARTLEDIIDHLKQRVADEPPAAPKRFKEWWPEFVKGHPRIGDPDNSPYEESIALHAWTAARQTAEPPSGWQPIEIAPKGDVLLLCRRGSDGDWSMHTGYWSDAGRKGWTTGAMWLDQMTRWMPMPLPPPTKSGTESHSGRPRPGETSACLPADDRGNAEARSSEGGNDGQALGVTIQSREPVGGNTASGARASPEQVQAKDVDPAPSISPGGTDS